MANRAVEPAGGGGEPPLERRIRFCNELTRAGGSNLWLVSRALPPAKHRFFTVAYASMRVIDDFVDDDFMKRPPDERAAGRAAAVARIAKWVAQAEAAGGGTLDVTLPGVDDPEIFGALNVMLGGSSLGAGPWRRLGDALIDDIREKPMATWDDFLGYCRGATVAPAEIFLYVLACFEQDGHFSHDQALLLSDYAANMGAFCYIVHICRDLKKDVLAGAAGQLVTIPADLLHAHGLDADQLAADLASGESRRASALLGDLIARAGPFRDGVDANLADLLPRLGCRERAILNGLLGVYFKLFETITADPSAPLKRKSLLDLNDKLRILKGVGIGAAELVR